MGKEEENEWSIVADNYNKIFRPRFKTMYEHMLDIIVKYKCSNVLDFAAGPGEPTQTFLERFGKTNLRKLICTDSSLGMLQIAKQLIPPPGLDFDVAQLDETSSMEQFHELDAITSSFGFIYIDEEGLKSFLNNCKRSLKKEGLVIGSVWAHPSKNPTLRILKCTGSFITLGEPFNINYLENEDKSFSWWSKDKVIIILQNAGFELVEWTNVEMPMKFEKTRDILEFASMADWFKDQKRREQAIEFAEELVCKELNLECIPHDGFVLNNLGICFVAKQIEYDPNRNK
jgi:ubiquinone/menaquinone biosynthesis C-methylase UbiE